MEVFLNGESYQLASAVTLKQLVDELQLTGKFAIEINNHIVPKSADADNHLNTGDIIEIVQAIGGG